MRPFLFGVGEKADLGAWVAFVKLIWVVWISFFKADLGGF
jgi:hypothetical protein